MGEGFAEDQGNNDTIFRPSARIGFEMSYPARILFEPETEQFETSIDIEFSKNWFGVLEAGILGVDVERDDFNYYSDGYFFRTGLDFNILGRETLKENDVVYFGLRYGYGKQKHGADNIIVYDEYWDTSYTTSVDGSDFESHWGEIVGGVKTELFANLFIGWSLRLRLILHETEETLMKPYRIAGFGSGGENTAIDFNYSIFYRIPF